MKVFEVKGRLKSITADRQTAVIEHETIPSYMPAMTMPFTVKNPDEMKALQPGDAIAFRFVATEDDFWIEQVRKVSDDSVARSPAGEQAKKSSAAGRIPALEIGDVVPNFRLTDQNGERFQFSDFAGKDVVLTFIFVRCPVPTFCPLMSENFRKLQEQLNASGNGSDARLLSITIDPEFDTPEVLRDYAARYTQDTSQWVFATGSAGEIDELTARFSVYVEPEAGTILHGLVTAHITPDGRVAQFWRGNGWKPGEIFEALRPSVKAERSAQSN